MNKEDEKKNLDVHPHIWLNKWPNFYFKMYKHPLT